MDFSFLRLWVDFDRLCWVDFGGLWLWRLVVVGLILGFSYNCWLIMGSGGFAVAVDFDRHWESFFSVLSCLFLNLPLLAVRLLLHCSGITSTLMRPES